MNVRVSVLKNILAVFKLTESYIRRQSDLNFKDKHLQRKLISLIDEIEVSISDHRSGQRRRARNANMGMF